MTTCLGKSCAFRLLCLSIMRVHQFVCVLFRLRFGGGMWDLIVLVPVHCLSFYFCII